MRQTLPAALLLGAMLATGGCQPARDPDTVPAPQAPIRAGNASPGPASATATLPAAAPANAPGTDAVMVADRTAPGQAEPRFDARAFAGTFIAPGTRLVIEPDGRYAISAGVANSAGSWSLEAGSGLLLLDPNAKDLPDQRFALPSHDELAPQDGGASLHRDAAGGER